MVTNTPTSSLCSGNSLEKGNTSPDKHPPSTPLAPATTEGYCGCGHGGRGGDYIEQKDTVDVVMEDAGETTSSCCRTTTKRSQRRPSSLTRVVSNHTPCPPTSHANTRPPTPCPPPQAHFDDTDKDDPLSLPFNSLENPCTETTTLSKGKGKAQQTKTKTTATAKPPPPARSLPPPPNFSRLPSPSSHSRCSSSCPKSASQPQSSRRLMLDEDCRMPAAARTKSSTMTMMA
ncbi:unnamed protein product [Cyclocybe aegerita]|uniref:Uncharacterized protein n=1 Tax=Cyclocybe aegerita TaxID=1973307 RepID=A0A8S0XS72_CYCAE|nr:unnamed protein product [Cyclocybe aegerita]